MNFFFSNQTYTNELAKTMTVIIKLQTTNQNIEHINFKAQSYTMVEDTRTDDKNGIFQ